MVGEYQPRIVDQELDELLADLAAVAIEGPRAVGKTATATRRASTVYSLDDADQLAVVAADPSVLDTSTGTVFVDEWQRHPPVWDYVRRSVDSGAPAGRFVLAGRAAPAVPTVHSGAGRIVRLRMRPMSLVERDVAPPTVSLGKLLAGERPPIAGESALGLVAYVDELLASGFPGIRHLAGRARRAQLESYLELVVEHDIAEQGLRVRRPATLRAWLVAYAAATATTSSYTTLLDAATPGEGDKPASSTAMAYRDVLSQLWLLDPVPGWAPGSNQMRRLTQAPKHHLTDPALAAHLLGVDADALLHGRTSGLVRPRDGSPLGNLFESLVTQSVRVYAQAREATVSHLRTRAGEHEVDLIVQRRDQRVLAIEVKLAGTPGPSDVRHLLWLRDQLGDDLLDAVVVTSGRHAYRRADGIAVVPAALLGP